MPQHGPKHLAGGPTPPAKWGQGWGEGRRQGKSSGAEEAQPGREVGLRRGGVQRRVKWQPVRRGTHCCSPGLRLGDPGRRRRPGGDFLRSAPRAPQMPAWLLTPPSVATRALPTAPASPNSTWVCTRTHTHTHTRTAGIPSSNTALPEPVLVRLGRGSTAPESLLLPIPGLTFLATPSPTLVGQLPGGRPWTAHCLLPAC